MKREIKFRVWDSVYLNWKNPEDYTYTELFLDDKYIVQQFTGMLDKNGKEIYEGDIIFCKVYYGIENRIGIVDYFASSFIVDWRNQIDDPLDEIPDIKVIGNIFENPELLK
jgi:hypothetical protein